MRIRAFPEPGRKNRPVNRTRLLAALLVFLLVVTAVVVVIRKMRFQGEAEASVVVTPVATPFVLPTPTPVPVPPTPQAPEGKTVEKVLVVIDPGHGGEDPGTECPFEDDFYEKEINLDIAKRVKGYLDEYGIDAMLTRESDSRLVPNNQKEDLYARARLANENNASLFISIHVNASDWKSVSGMEIYYCKKPDIFENFSSKRFAELMGARIRDSSGIEYRGIVHNDFSVLRNTEMPAILVETAFITNKDDYGRLKSDDFRDKTASGIAQGIRMALDEIEAFEYEGDLYVYKQAGGR